MTELKVYTFWSKDTSEYVVVVAYSQAEAIAILDKNYGVDGYIIGCSMPCREGANRSSTII